MPQSSSHNNLTTSVAGGTSAEPTPANNVGGGAGWGDDRFLQKGGTDGHHEHVQGRGHVDARNPRATMGSMLGLHDQKARAENKYMERADLAQANTKPMSEHGQPTCASEDHTFMCHRAGGSHTMPGWGTVKNIFGR
ncbi:uncharacterized protein N7459_001181 [Penicillium hispanicum]|uniref:uncharacterized protein n=1 Tax=Penicillium hispanicum TaxID=1080232 RepID=UPI0025402190|nr:uncharacterized protein N7459_001181 [Penicillium hispanicum]KAJ5594973.1 hypothetical protein N7459_001181 [Penicillium hispanicum]